MKIFMLLLEEAVVDLIDMYDGKGGWDYARPDEGKGGWDRTDGKAGW